MNLDKEYALFLENISWDKQFHSSPELTMLVERMLERLPEITQDVVRLKYGLNEDKRFHKMTQIRAILLDKYKDDESQMRWITMHYLNERMKKNADLFNQAFRMIAVCRIAETILCHEIKE